MKEKIRSILGEILIDVAVPTEINNTYNLIEDLGFTSLDMMQFILRLEDEFEIEIDIDTFDFSIFNSVARIESFILSCKSHHS
jgi:acyl carrier protein